MSDITRRPTFTRASGPPHESRTEAPRPVRWRPPGAVFRIGAAAESGQFAPKHKAAVSVGWPGLSATQRGDSRIARWEPDVITQEHPLEAVGRVQWLRVELGPACGVGVRPRRVVDLQYWGEGAGRWVRDERAAVSEGRHGAHMSEAPKSTLFPLRAQFAARYLTEPVLLSVDEGNVKLYAEVRAYCDAAEVRLCATARGRRVRRRSMMLDVAWVSAMGV